MQSNNELVDELRAAPEPWIESVIVVAFENRFEFVAEDHPDPASRLEFLQRQGGLAIGIAGVIPTPCSGRSFSACMFKEYRNQAWALRYMDKLRRLVRCHKAND